jgi:RecA-family ATPase
MEAGEKRANVCSSLGLAPATVLTITANAKKMRKTIGTANYKTAPIKYKIIRNFNVEKMEQLPAVLVVELIRQMGTTGVSNEYWKNYKI